MRPLLTCFLVLALSAPVADAAVFKGRTSQDRRAKVETNDRGFPVSLSFVWRARCSEGDPPLVLATEYRTPFDERTKTAVRDGGSYTTRVRDDQGRWYRVRVSGRMEAKRETRRRWTGTFSESAVIRRNGRVVSRCKTGSVSWRASR